MILTLRSNENNRIILILVAKNIRIRFACFPIVTNVLPFTLKSARLAQFIICMIISLKVNLVALYPMQEETMRIQLST